MLEAVDGQAVRRVLRAESACCNGKRNVQRATRNVQQGRRACRGRNGTGADGGCCADEREGAAGYVSTRQEADQRVRHRRHLPPTPLLGGVATHSGMRHEFPLRFFYTLQQARGTTGSQRVALLQQVAPTGLQLPGARGTLSHRAAPTFDALVATSSTRRSSSTACAGWAPRVLRA